MIKTNKWKNTTGTEKSHADKWIFVCILALILYGADTSETNNKNSQKPTKSIEKIHPTQIALMRTLDSQTRTPKIASKVLLSACKLGYLDVVKLALSSGADINSSNKYNETPLFIAMANKNSDIVTELLKNNPNLLAKTNNEHTILHWAARYNYVEVAKRSLIAKVDINAKCHQTHWTALHHAARENNFKLVYLLKENGADTNLRLSYGWQASDLVEKKFPEIARYLKVPLSRDSILPSERLISKKPHDTNSKLFSAIKNGKISLIANVIKENRSIIEASDTYGRTLLAFALQQNKPRIVELLASNNANLFAIDVFENSILHWAVLRSDQWLIKNILFNNENINLQNIRGDTPLHIAVKNNDFKTASTLIENDANPSISNLKGESVFSMYQNTSKEIQTLLTNMAEVGPQKTLKSKNAEVEIKFTGDN